MPAKPPVPARIHFTVAQKAPVAVVFRRGPAKQVATLLWNLETDELSLGQWLKGRIYEMRGDLSPDGKYMIYFAMDGRWQKGPGSWTAVSKTPYLKALAFYPKGDCWFGGGLWTGNRTYNVNGGGVAEREVSEVRQDPNYSSPVHYGGECPGVYFVRLQRDGWLLAKNRTKGLYVFEKPAGAGWILRKRFHAGSFSAPGKGCYWEEHVLIQSALSLQIDCPGWRCADVWMGELLWSEAGALYRGRLDGDGISQSRQVGDLNAMRFEAVAAPY